MNRPNAAVLDVVDGQRYAQGRGKRAEHARDADPIVLLDAKNVSAKNDAAGGAMYSTMMIKYAVIKLTDVLRKITEQNIASVPVVRQLMTIIST